MKTKSFKTIVFLVTIILPVINAFAQVWSEPVNISNSTDPDFFPDICVDTSGTLHCVWQRKININTCRIYYSYSEDQGDTWSNPQKISAGDDGWASDGMIVCDKSNRIYVIYGFDINNPSWENLWFTKYNGQYWSTPVTIADGWPGLWHEDMTIDNNGRIYVFWHYYDHRIHYKYYESNQWSQDFSVFDTISGNYFFDILKAECDDFNNLHCIGLYSDPSTYDTLKTAYYFYDYENNIWHYPVTVGTNRSNDPFTDIAVYNNNPYMVWRKAWTSYDDFTEGTLYKYKNGDQWSETELIVEDPKRQKIDIIDGKIFIADYEKEDDKYKAVFYKKNIFNQWEGQVIISDKFVGTEALFHDNDFIYVLINRLTQDENVMDNYIMKISIDSLIVTDVPKIKDLTSNHLILNQNYPNPFGGSTKIGFDLYNGGYVKLIIMNINGKFEKKFNLGKTVKGKHSVIWNRTDMAGNKLPAGTYYYRLIVDDRQKTKSLILK